MAASKSRKELRQDWADQPADGVSTTQELYLRETEDSDDDDDDRDYLAMQIGDDLPDFTAESTHGEIKFYEATENQWTLFVSFSRNYDPVATSELAQLAKMLPEFDERKVRVYGHSCNTQTNHEKWIQATEELLDCTVTFPLIADHEARVARLFGLVRHGCRVPVRGLLPASLVVVADPNQNIQYHARAAVRFTARRVPTLRPPPRRRSTRTRRAATSTRSSAPSTRSSSATRTRPWPAASTGWSARTSSSPTTCPRPRPRSCSRAASSRSAPGSASRRRPRPGPKKAR